MRKILSLVWAVVLTVLGLAALFSGAAVAFRALAMAQSGGPLPLGVLAIVVGTLVLAAAAASVALSSAGVIVVGALHVIAGLLYVVTPARLGGGPSPMISLLAGLRDINQDISDGAFIFIGSGFPLVLGFAMIAVGIGASLRSRRSLGATQLGSRTAVRVVSATVGSVLVVVLAGVAIGIGSTVYRNTAMLLRFDVLSVSLLVVATLALGAVLLVTRWTSLVAIGSGVLLTVAGLIGVIAPLSLYRSLPPEAAIALARGTQTGFVLAVGLTVLGLGLGAALRSRRTVRPVSV